MSEEERHGRKLYGENIILKNGRQKRCIAQIGSAKLLRASLWWDYEFLERTTFCGALVWKNFHTKEKTCKGPF